jgi:RNA recognition motif-containing protein
VCSNCVSLETTSIPDGSQDMVNERPYMPQPPCKAVTRNLLGGDDNSIVSLSNPIPRNVPHSEQDLSVSRTEGDHPQVGTTVKNEAKCYAMTKLGRHCIDAALPGSVYCCNHMLAARAVCINTVNSRVVRCCGKTNNGKQCKDTAKAGYLYCGNKHSETTVVPTTGGKIIFQCRCLTEVGTQCPNTAKTRSLYCGKHSLPPKIPIANREVIFRCSGVTHRGARCSDTAKAGSAYCRKHAKKPKAPPSSNILAQCNGRKMNGERCKNTTRDGELYCRNHTAPAITQSTKTDNEKIPAKVKVPDRQQRDVGEDCFVDLSHLDLPQEDHYSDTVNKRMTVSGHRIHADFQEDRFSDQIKKQMTTSGQTSKKSIDKHGGTMDRSHSDLQEDRSSETGLEQTTASDQASKKSVDKNVAAMIAHWHAVKAYPSFETAVVITNLPKVPEFKVEKLTKAVMTLMSHIGTLFVNPETNFEGIVMPYDKEKGTTKGCCLVQFETAKQAKDAVEVLQGYMFDKKHSLVVALCPRATYLKASGQASKKSVDKNGGAMNKHWHDGKASFRSAHGTYLWAWRRDSDVTLQSLRCFNCWEHWTKVSAENGKIALRSFHGTYLSAQDDGRVVTAPHAKEWEEWTQVQNGDGSVSFRSWLGTYLSACPDGSVRQSDNHQGWEHWHLVADSPDLPEHFDPSEKLARLHIPKKLELQNLLKAWAVTHREGSCSPISGNIILRGPRGKIPLLYFLAPA